ncbi:MAG: penicillin-binding protein 2 [Candidatus Pacebacteria bacterium]|nr:penicillin-binding protein 2 [Candidatus Paceibacterota bacterium]
MIAKFLERHPIIEWLWLVFSKQRTDVAPDQIALMRFSLVVALFLLGFLIIFVRNLDVVFFVQLPQHVPRTAEKYNMVRGNIYDRNGQLLATTVMGHSLAVDPKKIVDSNETARQISTVFPELDPLTLSRSLSKDRSFVYVKRDITPQQLAAVKSLNLKGMIYEPMPHRVYPYGSLLSHAVGMVNIDHQPQSGIEYGRNRDLVNLDNVNLSIDVRVQQILYGELQTVMKRFTPKGAGGIVMNIRNGEILGLVSLPDFDPNNPYVPDENHINRVTSGVYEMGSTFKIFNTALALELKKLRLDSQFDVSQPIVIGNDSINDFEKLSPILTVEQIFTESSNIGSALISDQFTTEQQRGFLRSLGLLKAPSLEIPGVGAPIAPKNWERIQKITVSYGHGISVSMLQMAKATAAMVNGGILLEPSLILNETTEPVHGPRVISADTSQKMQNLFKLVVQQGTGGAARSSEYPIGGKTGTAQKVDPETRRYSNSSVNASFVGIFPIDNPQYLVMILLDDPKGEGVGRYQNTAGKVAVPAVSSTVSQIGALLGKTVGAKP